MLRRLGIAQALLGDPRLLLLDEPTAGLDPVQRSELYGVINDLPADRCIVISTHSFEDVAAIADEVLIIAEGSAVWRGSLEQLRALGRGRDLAEFVPSLMGGTPA